MTRGDLPLVTRWRQQPHVARWWHADDKVGFTRGTWFDEPQRDGTTATVVGCTLDVRRVLGVTAPHGAP
jgi:hypothetical protein